MAIDIAASPFAQLALGEKFQLGSLEGFLQLAQAARDRGEIGDGKWALVVAARDAWRVAGVEWPLRKMQIAATNEKIAEAFPGIFGDAGSPAKALAALLLGKLLPGADLLRDPEALGALMTRTLLFGASDWPGFADDVERSLAASVRSYAFDPSQPALERACSFALMQRAFAQMVALKGFTGLRARAEPGRAWSQTDPVDADRLGLNKQIRFGAFVAARTGARAALSAEAIAGYDPASAERVLLASTVPVADGDGAGAADASGPAPAGAANTAGDVAFLRAMGLYFEATSPAAPWARDPSRYMLGDVQLPQNRAVIPDEAQALAVGLFALELKNLAASRLVPIVEAGRAARASEAPSGVVLTAGAGPLAKIVRLGDVAALIEVVAQVDQAMSAFARPGTTPETWASLVPFYSRATMASVFGPILFTEAELRAAVPASALGKSLKESLDRLKLPLAALALRLASAGAGEIEWDPASGFGASRLPMAPELRQRAQGALLRLAEDAQSSALAARARDL
jgi:hypothetical protein